MPHSCCWLMVCIFEVTAIPEQTPKPKNNSSYILYLVTVRFSVPLNFFFLLSFGLLFWFWPCYVSVEVSVIFFSPFVSKMSTGSTAFSTTRPVEGLEEEQHGQGQQQQKQGQQHRYPHQHQHPQQYYSHFRVQRWWLMYSPE